MSGPRPSPVADRRAYGFAGRIASRFIDSKLTPIIVAASLLLGAFAVLMLPREEEPQIKVPMIDVMVAMPGATAHEVENRVTRPMEKLLWEIPGVEYLYSTASPGGDMTIVRFMVGTDLEAALVRLNQKLQSNFDRIPPGSRSRSSRRGRSTTSPSSPSRSTARATTTPCSAAWRCRWTTP